MIGTSKMGDKVYCIRCYNFYIEDPIDIRQYKMKTPCTAEHLKTKLCCNVIRSKYGFFDADEHLCRKYLQYTITDDDTYLKPIKILNVDEFFSCESVNETNTCEHYSKIEYDVPKNSGISDDVIT